MTRDQTSAEAFTRLDNFIHTLPIGPFNVPGRFRLVLANGEDRGAIKGLGTYGAIKNSPGFIIGVSRPSDMDMEDFGYRMELIGTESSRTGSWNMLVGGYFYPKLILPENGYCER